MSLIQLSIWNCSIGPISKRQRYRKIAKLHGHSLRNHWNFRHGIRYYGDCSRFFTFVYENLKLCMNIEMSISRFFTRQFLGNLVGITMASSSNSSNILIQVALWKMQKPISRNISCNVPNFCALLCLWLLDHQRWLQDLSYGFGSTDMGAANVFTKVSADYYRTVLPDFILLDRVWFFVFLVSFASSQGQFCSFL